MQCDSRGGVRYRLTPTGIHDDGYGAPIRHLMLQQQLGRGAALLSCIRYIVRRVFG